MEFEDQKNRIQNQLDFEKTRDTKGDCVLHIIVNISATAKFLISLTVTKQKKIKLFPLFL